MNLEVPPDLATALSGAVKHFFVVVFLQDPTRFVASNDMSFAIVFRLPLLPTFDYQPVPTRKKVDIERVALSLECGCSLGKSFGTERRKNAKHVVLSAGTARRTRTSRNRRGLTVVV